MLDKLMKKGGSLANLPDKTRDDGGAITSTCHHRLNNLSLFMPLCQGKRLVWLPVNSTDLCSKALKALVCAKADDLSVCVSTC